MPAETTTPAAPAESSAPSLPDTHAIPSTYFPAAQSDAPPAAASSPTKETPATNQGDPPPAAENQDPPEKALTAKDFAEKRRSKKEERKELEQKAKTADELKAETDQMRSELETLRQERDQWSSGSKQWESKQKEWEALQSDLDRRVKDADQRYYDTYGPKYDPIQDEVRSKANSAYLEALSSIPDEVDGQDIFLDQLRRSPEAARGMDQAVAAYIQARDKHDGKAMTAAVEQFAKALGVSHPEPEFLRGVKGAIKAAIPHAQAIMQRDREIQEQAPQLAQQAWQKRHSTMSDSLQAIVRMDNSRIEQILQDPDADITSQDFTFAVANVLANEVPDWRNAVERELARDAESLAMLQATYQPPPLMSNDPAEIAKHDANFKELIGRQKEIMHNAALGRVLAKALPAIFLKLQDAQSRADETAEELNPGGKHQGGSSDPDRGGGGSPLDSIPSDYNAHRR